MPEKQKLIVLALYNILSMWVLSADREIFWKFKIAFGRQFKYVKALYLRNNSIDSVATKLQLIELFVTSDA